MNLSKHWAATLDDYVIDLAWSPDGALLAAASGAGGVTVYDAATGALKHALAGHEDGTNCLAWLTADGGQLLATGGQDGFVRIWDVTTGRQTAETKLGSAWVEHLVWMPVSGSQTLSPQLSAHIRHRWQEARRPQS